ncbi:MAG: peptidylprolyl isomerase [Thermomonas sp.]
MTDFLSSKFRRTALSILLAGLLPAAPVALAQTAPANAPVDRIAAVVNEDVILRSELDRALANIQSQYADKKDQLPPPDVLGRQVLERLILMRLQLARAKDSGITASDEEVDRALQGVAQQNNLTVDQLRERLTKEGVSYGEFRSNLSDEIITQKLQQSFAQARINVSTAEVDAALATAAAGGSQQFHLAHILINAPDGATPEQLAIAEKKIAGVKDLIDKGEMTFAAAAVRYSDSPNALEGGDLGWRGQNEIPPAFAASIKQMQNGQIIGPIRGPSGYQLLQLVDTRNQAANTGGQVTQYQARQILVKVDDKTDDATAKAKAETLAARLAGGADFAKLAAEASDDTTTKNRGGDLGWLTADTYGNAFAMQVAALDDKAISAPFKVEGGWVILQRMGSRQIAAGDENMRGQIRETIGRRKLEEEWSRYLRELRGEAWVDVRDSNGQSTAPKLAPAQTVKKKAKLSAEQEQDRALH